MRGTLGGLTPFVIVASCVGVTVFNCMGLAPPDHELASGQAGFGEYDAKVAQTATFDVAPVLLTDVERRRPLPFLWKT